MAAMFLNYGCRLVMVLWATMAVCVKGILEPKPSPDVWFPMDVMSIDGYIEGREYNGQLFGSPNLVPGVIGNALELNMYNVTQMVNFGNLRAECVGNPEKCPDGFTMATWLKLSPDITKLQNYIISSGGQTRHSWGIVLHYRSGQLHAGISTMSRKWSVYTDISLDDWHHVATVWNAELGLDLFINGTLKMTDVPGNSFSIASSQFNDLVLGAPNNGLLQDDVRGACILDDLLFWYRRLTASDLHLNFRSGEALLTRTDIEVTNGSPFPTLYGEDDLTSCYDLTIGQSHDSLLVEVAWFSDPLGDGATAMVTLSGNNLLDYVDVYMAGKPGDAVTALNKCQYVGTESGNFTLWSRNFACCCGGGSCSKIYLDYQQPIRGCHFVPYAVCWPVYICSVTAYVH